MFISVFQSFGQFKVFKNVYSSLQLLVSKAYKDHILPKHKADTPRTYTQSWIAIKETKIPFALQIKP